MTSDPTILQYVQGVTIEFNPSGIPFQYNVAPSDFNQLQNAIIAEEIKKLLAKGLLKISSSEPGKFKSPILLRAKRDGSYHMNLNLNNFNEFVQHDHF